MERDTRAKKGGEASLRLARGSARLFPEDGLRASVVELGPVPANDGITLTIPEGSLHGLLGENGAGKSTLMKVLSGFHRADSGEIILDSRSLDLCSAADAIDAGIGMLHQDPLVFLPFTVLENFLVAVPNTVQANRRTARKELAAKEAELHGIQGDEPLVLPVVDGQAVAEVVAGWIMIGDQDKPLVEQVHRNHKSRGRAGIDTVFSPFWEGAVQHFQKTVASYLVD